MTPTVSTTQPRATTRPHVNRVHRALRSTAAPLTCWAISFRAHLRVSKQQDAGRSRGTDEYHRQLQLHSIVCLAGQAVPSRAGEGRCSHHRRRGTGVSGPHFLGRQRRSRPMLARQPADPGLLSQIAHDAKSVGIVPHILIVSEARCRANETGLAGERAAAQSALPALTRGPGGPIRRRAAIRFVPARLW